MTDPASHASERFPTPARRRALLATAAVRRRVRRNRARPGGAAEHTVAPGRRRCRSIAADHAVSSIDTLDRAQRPGRPGSHLRGTGHRPAGCGDPAASTPQRPPQRTRSTAGDSLWAIAFRLHGTHASKRSLVALNAIVEPVPDLPSDRSWSSPPRATLPTTHGPAGCRDRRLRLTNSAIRRRPIDGRPVTIHEVVPGDTMSAIASRVRGGPGQSCSPATGSTGPR